MVILRNFPEIGLGKCRKGRCYVFVNALDVEQYQLAKSINPKERSEGPIHENLLGFLILGGDSAFEI